MHGGQWLCTCAALIANKRHALFIYVTFGGADSELTQKGNADAIRSVPFHIYSAPDTDDYNELIRSEAVAVALAVAVTVISTTPGQAPCSLPAE